MGTMSVEEIRAKAPEGAERYWVWEDGDISYYKQSESGEKWSRGYSSKDDLFVNEWEAWAARWDKATPLPKPAYSAENPPPDGWRGEVSTSFFQYRKAFITGGKLYFEQHGHEIEPYHRFREIPTPREKFIEQAQREGVDFGALYDEHIAKEKS